jgi:hypothetical protein
VTNCRRKFCATARVAPEGRLFNAVLGEEDPAQRQPAGHQEEEKNGS